MNSIKQFALVILISMTSNMLWGASGPFTLELSSASGPVGSQVNVAVSITNETVEVAGWQFSVCHSSAFAEVVIDSVQLESAAANLNGGEGPDFHLPVVTEDGWSVGTIIFFNPAGAGRGNEVLAVGKSQPIEGVSYLLNNGVPGDSVPICFCDDIGTNVPTETLIVTEVGESFTPKQNCGSLSITENQTFVMVARDASAPIVGSVQTSVGIKQTQSSLFLSGALSTQGFSMDLAHDSSKLFVTDVSVTPGSDLAALNSGTGPDFVGLSLHSEGWTVGVMYSFEEPFEVIQFDKEKTVLDVTYAVIGQQPIDSTTELTWSAIYGDPPVPNIVVVGGFTQTTTQLNSTITFEQVGVSFLRGDANLDLQIDIADTIYVIGYLHYGYSSSCLAALDANSDSQVNIGDAIFTLSYQLLGGAPPAAPFPLCGLSSNAGDIVLGCIRSGCP